MEIKRHKVIRKLGCSPVLKPDQFLVLAGTTQGKVPAHSPGNILGWLPRRNLVISADMAFHQRIWSLSDLT